MIAVGCACFAENGIASRGSAAEKLSNTTNTDRCIPGVTGLFVGFTLIFVSKSRFLGGGGFERGKHPRKLKAP